MVLTNRAVEQFSLTGRGMYRVFQREKGGETYGPGMMVKHERRTSDLISISMKEVRMGSQYTFPLVKSAAQKRKRERGLFTQSIEHRIIRKLATTYVAASSATDRKVFQMPQDQRKRKGCAPSSPARM